MKDATNLIWSNFIQLGFNSYAEDAAKAGLLGRPDISYTPTLRWDNALWDDLTMQMVDAGVNHICLGLADGVRYASHPEIAVDGAWTPDELKREIARLKTLGITVAPKLNFSTGHDLWLGDYHRMVSTPTYYQVCADLIAEVIDIFDGPPLFHLGYDEETAHHQRWYEYVVIRQHDLWWRDLLWFVEQVESRGSRPWIWSDYIWEHTGTFLQRMPRSVVQSNWYYAENFDLDVDRRRATERGIDLTVDPADGRDTSTPLHAYLDLADGGFDQIPTGSVWDARNNFPDTVAFAQQHLPADSVLGFMQTTWRPLLKEYREQFELGLAKFAEAKARYDPNGWSRTG